MLVATTTDNGRVFVQQYEDSDEFCLTDIGQGIQLLPESMLPALRKFGRSLRGANGKNFCVYRVELLPKMTRDKFSNFVNTLALYEGSSRKSVLFVTYTRKYGYGTDLDGSDDDGPGRDTLRVATLRSTSQTMFIATKGDAPEDSSSRWDILFLDKPFDLPSDDIFFIPASLYPL